MDHALGEHEKLVPITTGDWSHNRVFPCEVGDVVRTVWHHHTGLVLACHVVEQVEHSATGRSHDDVTNSLDDVNNVRSKGSPEVCAGCVGWVEHVEVEVFPGTAVDVGLGGSELLIGQVVGGLEVHGGGISERSGHDGKYLRD